MNDNLTLISVLSKGTINKDFNVSQRVGFFSFNIDDYFLAHLDMSVKSVFIACAFCLSPLKMLFIFKRDLESRLVDTLQTKGVTLMTYLFGLFLWSFFACHLVLIVLVIGALILELELLYSASTLVIMFVALVLFSYDMHVTCTIQALLFGNTTATVIVWVFLNPVQFLLAVSEFEPRTSLQFHFNPQLYGWIRVLLFAFVPCE